MAKLFVSYSRRDSVTARRLIEAFRSIEQDVWVDWESIPPAVDWLEQIFRGIEESDAFIFLISPDSIASEVCKVELNHAAQNNKRIIPIVLRDVPAKETPDSIRKLNWTYIREADNFDEGLAKVKTAIELDLDWLEEHRRLQVRSLEWHRRNDPSLLLRGRDLRNARHMLATATSKDPPSTDLQRTYINRSIQSERNRTIAWVSGIVALIIMAVLSVIAVNRSVEALRQQDLAEANAEEANIQAVYARLNQRKAERNELLARENEKEAEVARDAAREAEIQAEAQRSAARAQIYLSRPGELFTSTLLAIDSLRRDPSSAEAEEILRRNLSLLPFPVQQFAQAEKINGLAFHPEGNTFATASADGTACVWRVEDDELTNLFCTESQGAAINAAAFSTDGSFLVTGDQVGLVQVLNSESGDILHAFRRVDPPGSRIQIVDLKKGEIPEGYTAQEIPIRSISVRPTLIPQLAVAYDDGEIPIFDPNSAKISSPISAINRPNVSGVSPNGGWLVIGSESGRVSIWNLANDDRFSPSTHRGGVLSMAFQPAANKVATAGGDTIAMINPSIQKELYRIPVQSPVRDIAFSSDGAWFVTGSDDHRIRVWDTLSGNELLSMVQDGVVTDVAVSSNGDWIASTGADRTVRVWDAETGAELFQIPLKAAGSRVGFLNEDKWLVTTDQSGAIGIWDISGKTLPALSLPFEGVAELVEYSPSGEKLAVSSGDKVWLLTPDAQSILKETELGQPAEDLNSNISRLVFSPDSTLLGILTEENEVAIYNVDSRRSLSIPVSERIQSIVFSPDNQQLITGDVNGNLQAWDVGDAEATTDSDGFPRGTLLAGAGDLLVVGSQDSLVVVDENPTGSVTETELSGEKSLLAISHDGSRIASGSPNGEITIFQYDGGQLTRLTSFVKDQAASLAFTPDGTLLALGTARNAYLMDPPTGKEVARVPHLSSVNGVSFSSDGAYLATASSRSLNFWALNDIRQIRSEDLIASACRYLYENFSTAQWEQFFAGEEYEPLCKELPTP